MKKIELPRSFEDWKECIIQKCGIPLTPQYLQSRVRLLQETDSPETIRFRQLYGEAHYSRVVEWFKRALIETGTAKTDHSENVH